MKLMQFLMGLDDSYQPIRSAILTMDHLLDEKDAYNTISREESYKRIPQSSSVSEAKINATSIATKKLLSLINDSGSSANQHLSVSTVGMFNVVDIYSLKINLCHPNRTLATIIHVGNLELTNNVVLYDVFIVPGYCVSMLSDNKLIRDSKILVGFDEEKCYIQYLTKKKTLGTSSESRGLYLFDVEPNFSLDKCNLVMSFNVSKLLWHSKLSHPIDQVLSTLH
ncbi:hypothetical protein Tco_1042345 [Tanacetum coccineum]|uniref:GAG-pre-integrase domain-containing protein n=1 Tax=Tanacetum coccineum TaxID=301880 RepID=A0ABQ5GIU1_9ASTR